MMVGRARVPATVAVLCMNVRRLKASSAVISCILRDISQSFYFDSFKVISSKNRAHCVTSGIESYQS